MKLFKNVLFILVLVAVLAFVGTCAWQNCRTEPGPQPPPLEKAEYSVTIKATGLTYYSPEVHTLFWSKNGESNRYELKGYWEIVKGKWVFKDIRLILDEKVFGRIEVKKR